MCEVLEYFEINKNYFFTLFKYEKEVKTRLAAKLLDTIKEEVQDKKKKHLKSTIRCYIKRTTI